MFGHAMKFYDDFNSKLTKLQKDIVDYKIGRGRQKQELMEKLKKESPQQPPV